MSGYVLHSRPYRETSVIVDLFTRDHGRISVVFRGVKSSKGKTSKGRLLQPFQPLSFLWAGERELKTGRDFELDGAACYLTGNLLYSALYLNELLQRLLFKEDPHPELYEVYCQSLRELQELQQQDMAAVEVVLRRFEWHLLADLGYEITLERDSDYRPIDPALNYRYDADAGFLAVPRKIDPGYQQSCFKGSELLAMAEQHWEQPDIRSAAKRLMRLALAPHLGDKPLKSRELFRQLSGHDKPAPHASDLPSNKET